MFEEWLKNNQDHFRNDLDHHKEGVEGSYRRLEDWLRRAVNDNKSNS